MVSATASKGVGGKVQNLHTIIVLLSLERVLTKGIFKPQRFESDKLVNFEKLQISKLKRSFGQEKNFISHCFHYHDSKSQESDQVNP